MERTHNRARKQPRRPQSSSRLHRQRARSMPDTTQRMSRRRNGSAPRRRTSRYRPRSSGRRQRRSTSSRMPRMPRNRDTRPITPRSQQMEAAGRTASGSTTAAPALVQTIATTSDHRETLQTIAASSDHHADSSDHPRPRRRHPTIRRRARARDRRAGRRQPSTIRYRCRSGRRGGSPAGGEPSPRRPRDTGTLCGSGWLRVWGFETDDRRRRPPVVP